MILCLYQCDPEQRVIEELAKLLEESGLEDRSITSKEIVTFGHPLYTYASAGEIANDSFFPKIGVEFQNDDISSDLGMNLQYSDFNEQIKRKLRFYRDRHESEFENPDFAQFDKVLNENFKTVEYYTSRVESNVLITGWGGGGVAGRRTSNDLYRIVTALLPFLFTRIYKNYRVTARIDGRLQANIEAPEIMRGCWGFEFSIVISQLVRVYKFSKEPFISKADVYFDGKDSDGSTYQAGIKFQALHGKIKNYSPDPKKI
ncbi:hypothetical protein CH380_19155 [Leptospira adleri]|uniref:Uncharacterized protein n=1 Tax=Leptospira adleri TaxID=2023186 RepID=A0A2M9YJ53_9LEPT|nr:hypothetical protein CH380_19155 [Leptospira adleri]PJZ61923.1 hypothetical protein CH376_11010 [Leptospira adleri]